MRSHSIREKRFAIKCAKKKSVSRIVDHENLSWQWSAERLAW